MKKTGLFAIVAALTSIGAHADTIVTSKTYVDAKVSSSADISSTDSTTAPNQKAVYDALQSANSAVSNILTQIVSDADTTHAPSGNAVYDELAGKQNNLGGGANSGKAVIATDTAGTVAYTTIKTAVDSSSDLITAGAVKTYADAKVSTSTAVSNSDTTTAPNQKAVYDAIGAVQSSVTALQSCTHTCANTACDLITVSCVDTYTAPQS